MTEHWYKLDITCGVCEHEGKIVILGALLSKNPNQKEALAEFLSNLDAAILCNKHSENVERNAPHITK